MSKLNSYKAVLGMAGVFIVSAAAPEVALAGSGGGVFDTIWDTLTEWVKGTLGQVIVLSMIIVGIVAGIARQSIIAFAIGVGGGIGLFTAPDVIDDIFSATVKVASEAGTKALELAPAIAEVINGAAGTPHP